MRRGWGISDRDATFLGGWQLPTRMNTGGQKAPRALKSWISGVDGMKEEHIGELTGFRESKAPTASHKINTTIRKSLFQGKRDSQYRKRRYHTTHSFTNDISSQPIPSNLDKRSQDSAATHLLLLDGFKS
jgi:hypothetical protein